MGIINWIMHRSMRKWAEALVKWATDTYRSLRAQNPDLSDREIFAMMLDERGRFPGGDKDRDVILDRYGSSLNGLCYFLGLNAQKMKGMMVLRCVQFTEYVDLALQSHGFHKPTDETRQRYFKTLGLPETAVSESYLRPSH
jgi:hypothetical protein